MMPKRIRVINAHENNLKGISVSITHGKLCGVCGVSGSGKSTLACEVIAKYALNSFALSIPASMRRGITDGINPNVENIENIPPVVYIDVKNANRSIRSTIATTSGLMSVLRSMFSVCRKKEEGRLENKLYPRLFSYNISQEEGGGACEVCSGTGLSDSISVDSIIKNPEKSLFNGGISVVNEKGIKYTKITELFLSAFCKEYSIDTEKAMDSYSDREIELLFFGSDKIINFTDRSGTNGGKKSLAFKGIIGELLDVYVRTKSANIEKMVIKDRCSSCHGTRYNSFALQYRIEGYSIADLLNMSISAARSVINNFSNNCGEEMMGYIKEFNSISQELEAIGVGYLELNRGVASVSGGELQRVKLAKQIAMKLEGYCYVLDEPSTGLHNTNIVDLMKSINRLKYNGNTVILVEHNPLILGICDELIELGPQGGKNGGDVVCVGMPQEVANMNTLTGQMLKNTTHYPLEGKHSSQKYIRLYDVAVNNLKNIDLCVPLNEFVTVAGVSGSGKSSAINHALYEAVTEHIVNGRQKYGLSFDESIDSIIRLDQNASVTNSRSSVCTLLGLMDVLKDMFANQAKLSQINISKNAFSRNSEGGACPVCNGLGYIVDEDKSEELCMACGGTGYRDEVLSVLYKGYNISSIMKLSLDELVQIVDDEKIQYVICNCIDIGLGYLSLERRSTSLSKGEYQRLRVAIEIGKKKKGRCIYMLDEPSKGLHYSDVSKVVSVLRNLVKEGNTVIAIEHNIDVILQSDYVIEFGPGAGSNGGLILYNGEPSGLLNEDTPTADVIKHRAVISTETNEVMEKQEYFIPFLNGENICIDRTRLNILKGYIGSGKSRFMRDELFANSLKKYISCISTQGKYITRDMYVIPAGDASWPLTRLVSGRKEHFGKDERIIEVLNFSGTLERMYALFGKSEKQCLPSMFNAKKKAGKCPVCNGKGRFHSFDFDTIFSNPELEKSLISLLKERSRIERIHPLLKSEYGICISGSYAEMNELDKRIYVYGDRKKVVYYAPKKKEYTWDGCNAFLYSNMSYADEKFQQHIKKTWCKRPCKYCKQLGMVDEVNNTEYKGISFEKCVSAPVSELLGLLKKDKALCDDEKRLIALLETLVRYGLGDVDLYGYVTDLPFVWREIIQFISYCENPLANTIIAWDDFGAITDEYIKNEILLDLKKIISEGTTVLIADNILHDTFSNVIFSVERRKYEDIAVVNEAFNSIVVLKDDEMIKGIDCIEIKNNDSIATVTGIGGVIRDTYKKKYKKFLFTGVKEEEKCSKCKGHAYYEVNIGDVGFCKCECPDCKGTGFSEAVNDCALYGKSIGEVLKMSVIECLEWAKNLGLDSVVEKLKHYAELGLENVRINQKYAELSTNESVLFEMIVQWDQASTVVLKRKFLSNVDKKEKTHILNLISETAKRESKIVYMISGGM